MDGLGKMRILRIKHRGGVTNVIRGREGKRFGHIEQGTSFHPYA